MLLSKRIWGGQEKTVAMKAMNTDTNLVLWSLYWSLGVYIDHDEGG
jgi:hypothetical protein